jgi:hypothetical protein
MIHGQVDGNRQDNALSVLPFHSTKPEDGVGPRGELEGEVFACAIELRVVGPESVGKIGAVPVVESTREAADLGLGVDGTETVDGNGCAVRLAASVDDLEDQARTRLIAGSGQIEIIAGAGHLRGKPQGLAPAEPCLISACCEPRPPVCRPSASRVTTVDRQDCSGDETSVVGCEEDNSGGDFLRAADPTDRVAADQHCQEAFGVA